ncbi:hypothetical protein [Candidatus Nitrosocosmicus arcticus]|uniref:Uncharacterized protein n=1 Tax=Candidatus Nitrosocosmicus arcticus TaxID=2035267 RepID=A0A557STI6_9ARCH|nr:hypothetical protein [Candidatus Nitrosocosmicus arcticus]TVP39921.1 hypothetical protein NARC_110133 [Candidatus Nitrosocosmicus arcticus]
MAINPTDKILSKWLSHLDSDEGIRIESKSTCNKIFINRNLLGNYVLLMIYDYTKKMYPLSNSNINYTHGPECMPGGIIHLNIISEVLELIHGEFEEIVVNEY